MSLQRIWYGLLMIATICVVFFLGFLYGNREKINSSSDQIRVVGPNNSIQNSLSQIETRPVLGSVDSQNLGEFGQLYFKINDQKNTEILIRLSNVPATVKQTKNKKEKPIPNILTVATAQRSLDGLDYQYTEVGKIIFDEPKNGLRTAEFSSNLSHDLRNVERIVLLPTRPEDQNVFVDQNADLPPKVRDKPAPFFWVII
jgi:hypothetical protein